MKKLLAVIPFLLAPILATLLTTSQEERDRARGRALRESEERMADREERYREQRRREGCPLPADTWQSIVECAKREGLSEQLIPQTLKEPYRSHH